MIIKIKFTILEYTNARKKIESKTTISNTGYGTTTAADKAFKGLVYGMSGILIPC